MRQTSLLLAMFLLGAGVGVGGCVIVTKVKARTLVAKWRRDANALTPDPTASMVLRHCADKIEDLFDVEDGSKRY